MTFYPWINLSLASAASLGLLVLFLPPFNIPWFFFFILLPFQIAYLRYPKQGKWFVFPISLFLIYYLKIYTFPFYDSLIEFIPRFLNYADKSNFSASSAVRPHVLGIRIFGFAN